MFAVKRLVKQAGGLSFRLFLRHARVLEDVSIILMYHRVLDELPPSPYDRDLCVTRDTFEMHLNLLGELFNLVPLEDLVYSDRKGRICAITFDDGWLDNYKVAFPILKKYRVPATIFLPVSMIGTCQWFWFEAIWDLAHQAITLDKQRKFIHYFSQMTSCWKAGSLTEQDLLELISCLKQLEASSMDKIMLDAYKELDVHPPTKRILFNWEEAAEMGSCGITFGSHGLRHLILSTLTYQKKVEEISESLKILSEKDIPVVKVLCYPNGDWDDDCLTILSELGYIGAVITRPGNITSQTSPFLLNRIGIHEDISNSPSLFWFRIFQAIRA